MSELGDRIANLSPEKRALLERQLLERRAVQRSGGSSAIRLRARPPGSPPALSFAQQQLWFLDQWQPGGSAYNASLNIRFDGPVDEDILLRSFQTVVDRHETLRTVAVDEDGVPTARLLTDPKLQYTVVDLVDSEAPESDRIADAVRSVVERPFDLSSDVMLRVGLIRLGPDSRVVCMVMHHIACDGWSRGILFEELTAAYTAAVSGTAVHLPVLKVQYSDYAVWQHEWLQGATLEAERDFWRNELEGTDHVLELPTDHVRPQVLTFKGGRRNFEVPAEIAGRLRQIGRQERATPFMVIHAATGALLHGLTGQVDFCVGSPVANRRWPETEALIGFFVNTLLLRLRMRDDPSFTELVRRCRETAVNCYAHQDLPFDQVVQTMRPKRRSDRNPLFQVNLRMQGIAPDPPQLPGVSARRIGVGMGSSRFDLAFGFVDVVGAVPSYVEYNSALFEEATIDRWIAAFLEMLRMVTSGPDVLLSELAAAVRDRIGRS